jgi:hypothetical protein
MVKMSRGYLAVKHLGKLQLKRFARPSFSNLNRGSIHRIPSKRNVSQKQLDIALRHLNSRD